MIYGKLKYTHSLKQMARSLPFFKNLERNLNNQFARDDFVSKHLAKIPENSLLLDAGCGSQRYRKFCGHVQYRAQDFGKYTTDEKEMLGSNDAGEPAYQYGRLDYVGDIWNIDEKSNTFDAILCTEVLEHIPFPNDTVKEFSRLLKPNGTLILTAPSNCLRHMDPYFFYTGFSDRWYEKLLKDYRFEIETIESVGDYYSWLSVEIARTARAHSLFAKMMLFPAFLYYYTRKMTPRSTDTLCMGYHLIARKIP